MNQTNKSPESEATKEIDSDKRVPQFPRGSVLPGQSPLYWVEQKDRYLRQLLIKDIEELTGRRLIVYFTNRSTQAIIDHRNAHYMTEMLSDYKCQPVDLLIETNGGITDATESLVAAIKHSVTDFRVIVARAAKSGGTILALASSEIVMGASSELGPIDPQYQGIPATIIIQNQSADFNLRKICENWILQTNTLAKKCLRQGMFSSLSLKKTDQEIDGIFETLSSGKFYFSHGSAIDHKEAAEIGLNVKYLPPDDQTWQRIWLLYCMYEFDCRQRGLLKIFETQKVSNGIAAPPTPVTA